MIRFRSPALWTIDLLSTHIILTELNGAHDLRGDDFLVGDLAPHTHPPMSDLPIWFVDLHIHKHTLHSDTSNSVLTEEANTGFSIKSRYFNYMQNLSTYLFQYKVQTPQLMWNTISDRWPSQLVLQMIMLSKKVFFQIFAYFLDFREFLFQCCLLAVIMIVIKPLAKTLSLTETQRKKSNGLQSQDLGGRLKSSIWEITNQQTLRMLTFVNLQNRFMRHFHRFYSVVSLFQCI